MTSFEYLIKSMKGCCGTNVLWFQQLVNVSKNKITGEYWTGILHRDDWFSMDEAMYMASYLCKAYSKPIGQGMHVFDASRV